MKRTIHPLFTTAAFLVATSHFVAAADVPEDIAEMKVQDLRAGGDDKKRYFVINAQ